MLLMTFDLTWEFVDLSTGDVRILLEVDAVPVDVARLPIPPAVWVLKSCYCILGTEEDDTE
jgi:hypothetical protein